MLSFEHYLINSDISKGLPSSWHDENQSCNCNQSNILKLISPLAMTKNLIKSGNTNTETTEEEEGQIINFSTYLCVIER